MEIVVSVVGALVMLGEGVGLWYLLRQWRGERARADANDLIVTGLTRDLITAYREIQVVRDLLAERNKAEAINDRIQITNAPGLDDALSRINGLRTGRTGTPAGTATALPFTRASGLAGGAFRALR